MQYSKPFIGDRVFILSPSCVSYGVVTERRTTENATGLIDVYVVDYFDAVVGGHATQIVSREQLQGEIYIGPVLREWLNGHGRKAKEFADKRVIEIEAEKKSAVEANDAAA